VAGGGDGRRRRRVSLAALAEVLAEIGDLKRVRAAHAEGSVAERRFAGAWAALAAGEDPAAVARREAAAALAGARLGAIDAEVLRDAGVAPLPVLERAFDELAGAVAEPLRGQLRATLGDEPVRAGRAPAWVGALARQPRAGATRPGHARILLQPEESHAEHCWVVAVGAVLAAGHYGTAPEEPFLRGLAHHLHNAALPDSGFAGEALLGAELSPAIGRLTRRALAALDAPLRARVERALAAEDPAFHAADVLDRVLEMRHHARTAAFTVEQAVEELDLVHAGPEQAFGLAVLEEAGLR